MERESNQSKTNKNAKLHEDFDKENTLSTMTMENDNKNRPQSYPVKNLKLTTNK